MMEPSEIRIYQFLIVEIQGFLECWKLQISEARLLRCEYRQIRKGSTFFLSRK